METITVIYTLFCLLASAFLSSVYLSDPRQSQLGIFLFFVFMAFAWLTYIEVFNPALKNSIYRAHLFRGIMSLGLGFLLWRKFK